MSSSRSASPASCSALKTATTSPARRRGRPHPAGAARPPQRRCCTTSSPPSTPAGTSSCCPPSRAQNIRVLNWDELDDARARPCARVLPDRSRSAAHSHHHRPAHPFPRVLNKALCIALLLRRKRSGGRRKTPVLGVVTVPRALPRLVALPSPAPARTTSSFCTT